MAKVHTQITMKTKREAALPLMEIAPNPLRCKICGQDVHPSAHLQLCALCAEGLRQQDPIRFGRWLATPAELDLHIQRVRSGKER